MQEKLRCRAGRHASPQTPGLQVYDKARAGPNLHGAVVVSKCADALPLYRQAKAYRRVGVQVSDSMLGDYFHRTAEITKPLSERNQEIVADSEIVLADETVQRVLAKGKTRRAWIWSFIGRDKNDKEIVAYVHAKGRGSETPARVLDGTAGKLVADAYAGYDRITEPGKRERAGCLAHVRRKFHDALGNAPEPARTAIEYVLDIYRIERAVLDETCSGRPSTSRCGRRRAAP